MKDTKNYFPLQEIGYKGEYSNRLKDRSYGEVELVPWN